MKSVTSREAFNIPARSREPRSDTRRGRGLLVRKRDLRRYIGPKRMVVLVGLLALVLCSWQLRDQGMLDPDVLTTFLAGHPWTAAAIFIGLYSISVIGALPTLPLNLAAGLFWGPLLGGAVAACATSLGALVAFGAARSLFGQPLARRFDHRLVAWLQDEFDVKGWRFIAFLRLNPVFPTGPLNYLLGLTSISTLSYSWATAAFLLPPSILVALIGHQTGTFVARGEVADLVATILVVSGALTLLVAVRYAAKYLNQSRRRQP